MTDLDTALENQWTPRVDAQGYVIGSPAITRSRGDALAMLKLLKDAARRYPFDPTTLVLPAGYVREPVTGRGIRVEELGQHDGYYVMDLRGTYALPNEEAA